MPVRIEHEKPPYDGPAELCMFCGTWTRCWWADGCAPLCSRCSREVNHGQAYHRAEQIGYGPLPNISTNTD